MTRFLGLCSLHTCCMDLCFSLFCPCNMFFCWKNWAWSWYSVSSIHPIAVGEVPIYIDTFILFSSHLQIKAMPKKKHCLAIIGRNLRQDAENMIYCVLRKHPPASSKWPFNHPNKGHQQPLERSCFQHPKKVTNGRTWQLKYPVPCRTPPRSIHPWTFNLHLSRGSGKGVQIILAQKKCLLPPLE